MKNFNYDNLKECFLNDGISVKDNRQWENILMHYHIYIRSTKEPLNPKEWIESDEWRKVFQKIYSFSEIAFLLKLKKKDILNYYRSAMYKLRKKLMDEEYNPDDFIW